MYNGIRSIDHPLIAVADMQQSRVVYERLGFTIPPRGSHIEWGTGNWCIMFEHDYLELRGILDAQRETLGLEQILATYGEGLAGVAFGTEGAEISFQKLNDNQIMPKPVRYLTRNFEVAEQWLQPKFALCFVPEQDIRGLTHVVLCEHLTPELMRKPEYLRHANDAQAVLGMTGIVDDLDAVQRVQQRLLGKDAVHRDEHVLTLNLPSGQFIRLMHAADYDRAYPKLGRKALTRPEYLVSIHLQVGDIHKTQRALDAQQILYTHDVENSVWVAAQDACGVMIEFKQL